jgi:hypothetical protein
MPGPNEPMVQGDQTPAVVPNDGTPSGDGVANATPVQSPVDAEALRREFEENQKKLQQDLNRTKSTFQSREAQIQREARQREAALLDELNKTRLSTMDDETRKTYEAELSQNRIRELEQENESIRSEYETYKAMLDAKEHFRKMGVPDDILIVNGTFDDLLQSGWDWVSNRLIAINSAPAQAPVAPPKAPAPLPVAPKVDTGGNSTPPSTRPTWDDYAKKGMTREQVYQKFQEGKISPDAMPL